MASVSTAPIGFMPESYDCYVEELTSEESGRTRKILNMRFKDGEQLVRCVTVGCDEDDKPIEKHVTYKFPWDIKKVALVLEGGGKVNFKYVTTERYERQWTYFGTYMIGQTVSVVAAMARKTHPYLLGLTIEEELDKDILIPMVDESRYLIHDGFTSEEPTNPSLATMMEQEIARLVDEWKSGKRVFPCTGTVPTVVDSMKHDLDEYLTEGNGKACAFCEEEPCVWLLNHDSILAWDALEHEGLDVKEMPTANLRRKKLYRQMALTVNGGPMGKGVRIEHPRCVLDGIKAIAPDPDGK